MNLYPHPIKTHLIRMKVTAPAHVQFYDLDSRHILVFAADEEERAKFRTIALIDVESGRIDPVPDPVGTDSLSRLQDAWLFDDGRTFIVKTGRIQWWEKQKFWELHDVEYTDQVETLAFCPIDELIRCVRDGRPAIPWTVLAQSDRTSALHTVGEDGTCFAFAIQHFPWNRLQTFQFHPTQAAAVVFVGEAEGIFEEVLYCDGMWFGSRRVPGRQERMELVDLAARRTVLQVSDWGFVAAERRHALAYKGGPGSKRGFQVTLYDWVDNKKIQTWKNRYFHYDLKSNTFLLF